MTNFRRRAFRVQTFALALTALAAASVPALAAPEPYETVVTSEDGAEDLNPRINPSALSNADRLSYTSAFDALRRGDLETARASARQANDRVLLGTVEFERLVEVHEFCLSH